MALQLWNIFSVSVSLQFALQEEQVGQSASGLCKHFDRLEVGLQRGVGNI